MSFLIEKGEAGGLSEGKSRRELKCPVLKKKEEWHVERGTESIQEDEN